MTRMCIPLGTGFLLLLLFSLPTRAQVACEDTAFFCITNTITPNGDGYNDVWFIRNVEDFPGTQVQIFTTAGKLIYAHADYRNTWTGLHEDGKPLPAGPYYFVVQIGGTGEKRSGVLLIVRDNSEG